MNTGKLGWWTWRDSNSRPLPCHGSVAFKWLKSASPESIALTTLGGGPNVAVVARFAYWPGGAMPNPYELVGRLRKAAALADYLADQGFSSEMAAAMDQDQWRAVATHARVNMPSALSQVLVIEQLRKVRTIA